MLLPISGKLAGIEATVLNVGELGDTVFAEAGRGLPARTGEVFELPVVGVFELRDGRISAWRDYFDGEQVRRPRLAPPCVSTPQSVTARPVIRCAVRFPLVEVLT